MNNCCEMSVPQSGSSFETFERPVADWAARLTAGLTRSVQASEQTLGQPRRGPRWFLLANHAAHSVQAPFEEFFGIEGCLARQEFISVCATSGTFRKGASERVMNE
jgi:hypothetical protein